jgi:C-terminal processing protease CtpA/Prc
MNLRSGVAHKLLIAALLVFTLIAPAGSAYGQKVEAKDRDRGLSMLGIVKNRLKSNYYDPNFRGMDLDTRFKTAEEKIKEATSVGQIFGIIAQVLAELDDSHTFFIPPNRTYDTDYGWTMQIIGDRCYVSSVVKDSDAEAKGVKAGDEVLEVGGHQVNRAILWKLQYLYNTLRPQPSLRVMLRSPNGEQRQLDLLAKQKQGKKIVNLTDYNEYMNLVRKSEREAELGRDPFKSYGDQLLIWKMHEFDLSDSEIDAAMSKVKKHKALVLDLRGNSGGWITTITRLLANLFDHDVKVGDTKFRKETKPLIAKSRGEKAFNGKLTILVDSRSASAAEILARVVQLEKRGTVIGDQTSGAVMTSLQYNEQVGLDIVVFFGVSVTVADLIMSDGSSLEHRGVTPDQVRLPTAEDLAAGRDVVMSYAASLEGVTLDPVEAFKLFPEKPRVPRN